MILYICLQSYIYSELIQDVMRRCRMAKRKSLQEEVFEPENNSSNEEIDEVIIEKKRKDFKNKKLTKKPTKKTKSNLSNDADNQDSRQSDILDIRNSDQTTRQHIRPAFLKRWNGISNDFQLTLSDLNDLSPMMKVYWQTKSKNMNAIIFLQFGKMQFFAFQDDAIKLNQLFKKKLKQFSKFLMVNFWYKEIQHAKKELFDRKIPVLIMNEIQDQQYRNLNGIMRRQINQVLTPGLHLHMEDSAYRQRLILAFYKFDEKFAVLVLDAESNHFYLEELVDDDYFHEIRRIINRYRPVEVIVPDRDHKDIIQIAKQICSPYTVEINFSRQNIQSQLERFVRSNNSLLFQELVNKYHEENVESDIAFSRLRTVQVLALIWQYLDSLCLCEKIFHQGLFSEQCYKKNVAKPFFDSQVYQNLEVFRLKDSDEGYAQPGTLIAYLDKCKTVQGKKLLHRWLDQPLLNKDEIIERQIAVRELVELNSQILILHEKLMAYEKFQKRIADVYHWVIRNSEKGKLTLTKYINYEKQYDQRKNPAIVKLKQIVQLLNLFQEYEGFLRNLKQFRIKSKFLLKLVQIIEIDNIHIMPLEQVMKIEGIPEISYVAESIKRQFIYDQISDHLEPAPGLNEIYDHEKHEIEEINKELQLELQRWKEHFGNDKVIFVSVRAKNQIQVPKGSIKSSTAHEDLIFSSETANAIRYTTPKTYELSEALLQHEPILSQAYEPFLQQIVAQFCSFRYLWDMYIQSIAKLDVVMSLAQTSRQMPYRCMPQFCEDELVIRKGCHASLLQVKEDVIPNTLQFKRQEKFLLLTGPNMGGKSTLLKQTCLLAIMAQIGCFVPAEEYRSIIFDQIFCRIGASDRIYQGKSTFYVELEETKRIINRATSSSLVIIDELGRGTSTYDGMAIAEAVMDFILGEIGCFTLFSTHYTQITEKFKGKPEIKLMKMSTEIVEDDIHFTYQVVEGIAEKSFASNVGRMVGIPTQILKLADKRSEEMHHETRRKKMLRQAYRLVNSNGDKCVNSQQNTMNPQILSVKREVIKK